MDVRNCRRCGQIYSYTGYNICPQCRKDDEKDFKKVKKYLDENPGANISKVSEKTEVDSRKIIEFLREGRLEVKDAKNAILTCEKCGTSIRTGRFCEKCTVAMEREFKGSISGKNKGNIQSGRAKERIRVAERYRNR